MEDERPALPPLKIRDFEVPYPIFQGGMGVGVSWAGLAGAAAKAGIVGIVSAIGTGYRYPDLIKSIQGRPIGPENMNCAPALRRIMTEALENGGPQGIVGVNILCAINGYEQVVRESVASGARVVISGAGLPMALPEFAADSNAALVPIVSSDRALKLICKSWQKKYNRLPDAVVLEGPESGGHQGFTAEQCGDPAYALEALLGPVVEERDRWGTFPVIAGGGVWDRADIDRLLAQGAGGVQIGTRFIGTFECDAAMAFKTTVLQAGKEDIALVKSPVGMPGRAVQTELQRSLLRGDAPPPTPAATVPPALDRMRFLGKPEALRAFKSFWVHLDRSTGPQPFQQRLLAQCFGLQEHAFLETLRHTEQLATGGAQASASMALGDYGLAILARFRLDLASFEPQPILTRMVTLPPSAQAAQQLRELANPAQRLRELGQLGRQGFIAPQALGRPWMASSVRSSTTASSALRPWLMRGSIGPLSPLLRPSPLPLTWPCSRPSTNTPKGAPWAPPTGSGSTRKPCWTWRRS